VTLGFAKLDGYLQRHPYFGASVGRYCNRIARGTFGLDGQTYALANNNGPHHLHGGDRGFDRHVWAAEERELEDGVGIRFTRTSRAGEEGYPGNLQVTAEYVLTDRDELRAEFTASTDAATPVNLTNDCYWNLGGAGTGDILDHELMIAADQYLPVDDGLIPTGKLADVAGTPLDFRRPKRMGQEIAQLAGEPGGYDHCFVLRSRDGSLALAGQVKDPQSGRVMEVWTTQPGLQFYTGNFLDATAASGGFAKHHGFCLETQHFPDSPNQAAFPSTILRPGETYRQVTVHRFSAE
jgi:aldose 1-epimerase